MSHAHTNDPYRGREFDPDSTFSPNPGAVDEGAPAGADDGRVDGQVEGVFAAMLGNETPSYAGDAEADEFVAADAEKARARVLAQEAAADDKSADKGSDAKAADDLASAVESLGR